MLSKIFFLLTKLKNRERKREKEELARSGQSANKVANTGSSIPGEIPIQIGLVTLLVATPYLNFTQQEQKSELRARNSCSTRRRRNLRIQRQEEKWVEERRG